jgi:anti-anti-sigma regulatory factor
MNYVNTVQLLTSSPSGLRAQVIAAANDTIRSGQRQLIVDLDNLTQMDDAVLSALILALRRLRGEGGSLRVVTSKDAIRGYLDSTGMKLAFGMGSPTRQSLSEDLIVPRGDPQLQHTLR